jgi:dephospho-CoA kinase
VSKRWPGKIVIGLTGNIATGKSVVRRMLEALDAFTIDADGLAHRAMSPQAPAYQPIVDTFGKWILQPDEQIDRNKLAKIVFTDPDALSRLETITHPIVKQVVDLLIRRSKKEIVVIEAIKLIEASLSADVDSIWVVDAPEQVQVTRLVENRELSEPEARMRIAAQPPQSQKLARANVIIYNADGYENTFEQVQRHLNELIEQLRPKAAPTTEPTPATEPSPPTEPTPAPPTVLTEATPAPTPTTEAPALALRRGGPKDAEVIANFINQITGQSLSRTDVLVRFGQKAYMLAYAGDQLVGVGGWQVENLITRIDELHVASGAPADTIVSTLIDEMEKASNDLQSEVSLLFLGTNSSDSIKDVIRRKGYEVMQPAELRVPDWREAAE